MWGAKPACLLFGWQARLYDVAVTIGKVKQITAIRTPHEMTFTEQRGTLSPLFSEIAFPLVWRAWQWVTPPQIDVRRLILHILRPDGRDTSPQR